LTGVAVKVTLVPAQIELEVAAIETLAVTLGYTVIVTALEVAGLPDAHVALEVRMHVTRSLFANVVLV
jgi:hypothetical protein